MSECVNLLPNNATAQERALECATARVGGVDVPISTLSNPAECQADLLPWLAWAFSVDRWESDWTEKQKRDIIDASLFLHKRKGTPAAVKEIIELIFGGGDLLEPWQFGGDPHTFKISTTGTLRSKQEYDRLISLVNASKPARSWLIAVQVRRETESNYFLGLSVNQGVKNSIALEFPDQTAGPVEFVIASGVQCGSKSRVAVRFDEQTNSPGPLNISTAYHRFIKTTIGPAGILANISDSIIYFAGAAHAQKLTTIKGV